MKALGKVCVACGKERKVKYLLYHPTTFLPYCHTPYLCNEDHPNSTKNILANKEETTLYPEQDILKLYTKHLESTLSSREDVGRVQGMLQRPIGLRIVDPAMAEFLVQFQDENGFSNMSDTIRFCIQTVADNRGSFYKDQQKIYAEKKDADTFRDTLESVEESSGDDADTDNSDLTF